MDHNYKEKYLRLKAKIAQKSNSKRFNPKLAKELENLVFVVDDKILEPDAHLIILSLIEKFHKIAVDNDLADSLEISQYYDVTGLKPCENCEIVLKYFDIPVCITNVNTQTVDETGKKRVDCQISRGQIKFFIKQKDGNCYRYSDIRTVKIDNLDSLQHYVEMFYQNTEELEKISESAEIAVAKAQKEIISDLTTNGKLDSTDRKSIDQSIQTINQISTEIKNAAGKSQLSKMNGARILSKIPNNSDVDVANIVAKYLMNTNTANQQNLVAIMVAGNQPIPLQANPLINTVTANITSKEILAGQTTGENVMETMVAGDRAVISINANLAIVPLHYLTNQASIAISAPSQSTTALQNKLALYGAALKGDNTGTQIVSLNSIVPVSQNLSVMTSVPPDQASHHIPLPQSNNGQQTAYDYLESKLRGGSNTRISHSKTAIKTVMNGSADTHQTNKSSTMYPIELPYQQKTNS